MILTANPSRSLKIMDLVTFITGCLKFIGKNAHFCWIKLKILRISPRLDNPRRRKTSCAYDRSAAWQSIIKHFSKMIKSSVISITSKVFQHMKEIFNSNLLLVSCDAVKSRIKALHSFTLDIYSVQYSTAVTLLTFLQLLTLQLRPVLLFMTSALSTEKLQELIKPRHCLVS